MGPAETALHVIILIVDFVGYYRGIVKIGFLNTVKAGCHLPGSNNC